MEEVTTDPAIDEVAGASELEAARDELVVLVSLGVQTWVVRGFAVEAVIVETAVLEGTAVLEVALVEAGVVKNALVEVDGVGDTGKAAVVACWPLL